MVQGGEYVDVTDGRRDGAGRSIGVTYRDRWCRVEHRCHR
jgi:hypothetical protein